MKKDQRISVHGLGYIGLPTAAILASSGYNVVGIDIEPSVVDSVNLGQSHIVEPGLGDLLNKVVTEKSLVASTDATQADIHIIAVPTPLMVTNENLKEPDISYIEAVCYSLASKLNPGNLIIIESTSPIGTTERMCKILAEQRKDLIFPDTSPADADINIAYCPERVLPGKTLKELVENDRIIGGISTSCAEMAQQFYQTFVNGACICTNARTAEMAKLTENASRDNQIAFANELSLICDQLDINVWELITLANRHPRVNILNPGPGVGGHCIAVDPWFIVHRTPTLAKLIKLSREVNDSKPDWVIEKIKSKVAEIIYENKDRKTSEIYVACFGITFKADIDDVRESPALYIVERLMKLHDGPVNVVEPNLTAKSLPHIKFVKMEDAINDADIAVLLVDHKEFKCVKRPSIKKIIDTRGIW